MKINNFKRRLLLKSAVLGLSLSLFGGAMTASAETTLRLSTQVQPNSDGHNFALDFAERVSSATGGRVKINVYPANQLGDWTEVHEQLMQGAVDIGLQSLSTKFDKTLALSWFPYAVEDYAGARKAYSKSGYVYEIVSDAIAKQDLKLLSVYGAGMGGAGFIEPLPHPRDPNARQDSKIRIWPGGTTHRALMERFGFNTSPLPWSDLYVAQSTGVVDGMIGGTATQHVEGFKDITKMWVQYNDHYEPLWLVMNMERFEGIDEQDRKAILDVAQEVSLERFDAVEAAEEKSLQVLRDAGIEVVILSKEELASFAEIARKEVWPKIEGEIGSAAMARLKKELDLQ
jgi:TRAP-type C4-dicarboxylate transport system substrate-binding protein